MDGQDSIFELYEDIFGWVWISNPLRWKIDLLDILDGIAKVRFYIDLSKSSSRSESEDQQGSDKKWFFEVFVHRCDGRG